MGCDRGRCSTHCGSGGRLVGSGVCGEDRVYVSDGRGSGGDTPGQTQTRGPPYPVLRTRGGGRTCFIDVFPGEDGHEGEEVGPVCVCFPALFLNVFAVVVSCLRRWYQVELADGSFKLCHTLLVAAFPQQEGALEFLSEPLTLALPLKVCVDTLLSAGGI